MRSIFALLAAASLVFSGCAAQSAAEGEDEIVGDADEALTSYGASLVGAWRVMDGYSLDLNELVLKADGTFIWHHNIFCVKAPCPTRDEGKFIAYKPAAGSVQGRVRLVGKEFGVRQYVVVKGFDGTIKLSRYGNTAKLENIGNWCGQPTDCAGQTSTIMIKCAGGYHSVDVCTETSSCSKNCVKDEPKPAACVVTGCSGQICADSARFTTCEFRPEYACYKTAICERDAAGACGFRKTAALTKCLTGSTCSLDDPTKTYVGTSPEQCTLIRFVCAEGKTYFSNDCGCGCE